MDAQSQSTIKFLQSIAQIHQTLAEFARLLLARPQIQSAVVTRFSPTACLSYFGGELGVTTTLKNSVAVDWWLELKWDENHWTLEYSVEHGAANKDGTHTAIAFPAIQTTELDTFPEQLGVAIANLIATSSDETLFH